MVDGPNPDLSPPGPGQRPRIAHLVDRFMQQVELAADDEDWRESDGWVGRMVLKDPKGDQAYVYRIKDGKMVAADSQGPFVATIIMSVDTLLDLVDSALNRPPGMAEDIFQRKYAQRYIAYQGERWIVDSERFRKVFRRLGAAGRKEGR